MVRRSGRANKEGERIATSGLGELYDGALVTVAKSGN